MKNCDYVLTFAMVLNIYVWQVPEAVKTLDLAKYTIDTSVRPVDAFELATKCLQAWENFIRSNISNEASV